MTDMPRYGACKTAKIAKIFVENCQTLQDYFKIMQCIIKVLTVTDH